MTSTIKVNKIEKESGSTITLGGPSTAVTLACGATQTGFGRTGTVDWCTTAKTGPLTAVSGKGYFINTCGGAITITLPASPSAGDIVALKDYANTWDDACKAVTVARNGSKINGAEDCATLNTESQSVTLIYVDATKGWQDIHDSTSNVTGTPNYITASGGNATLTVGDYKTHIFTADGNFVVTAGGTPSGSNVAEYLVVAGGGGGGVARGAGGGAGGFRMFTSAPGSNSPLNAPAGLSVTAQTYAISVGGAGTGKCFPSPSPNQYGGIGGVSTFSTITSAGGGGGGGANSPGPSTKCADLNKGGSGGGGGFYSANPATSVFCGGVGNTPPTAPPQGQNGGPGYGPTGSSTPSPQRGGGGGGGAGAAGVTNNGGGTGGGGCGGVGSYIADPFFGPTAPSYGTPGPTGSTRYFSGGGGGGRETPATGGAGGSGGGTDGKGAGCASSNAANNTGGGAGGTGEGSPSKSGNGGSGFVAIRYKFQN